MTKVKICGLKRLEDVKAANGLGPDYAGFVFAGTKRKIDDTQAQILRNALSPSIPSVGVFVNEPLEHMIELVKKNIIQLVQLHGEEGEEDILKLRKGLRDAGSPYVPIIKAVRVRSETDIWNASRLSCDMLLLDAYSQDGRYGGTGTAFDPSFIPSLTKPFFLAGGLTPENVRGLVDKVKPWGVDVSSGVETEGFKDPKKMAAFLDHVRRIGE